jgi:cytochrome c oxidase subunit 2
MTSERQSGNGQGILFAIALSLLVVVFVALCAQWLGRMPKPIAQIAHDIDHLFRFILTIAFVIFLLAHLYLIVAVWRFRFREGRKSASVGLERRDWIWILAPVALILLADIVFDHKSNRIWAQVFWKIPQQSFIVEVTGEQFAWSLRYPGKDGKLGRSDLKLINDDNTLGIDPEDPASKDDIFIPAGQGELHLPLNHPVLFLLHSKDVLHSFSVPFARLKMDCVPSMTTRLWFTPTKAGTYEFSCAELCGLGHYKMRGVLVVEPMGDLKRWMEEQGTFGDMLP